MPKIHNKSTGNILKHYSFWIIMLFVASISSCHIDGINTEVLACSGYIVDNFNDKRPLEGLYIEVKYDADLGDGEQILTSALTDEKGFFELNGKYFVGLMSLDSWTSATVFASDAKRDTLGEFGFQFADGTYKYITLHVDTFSLQHNVWVVPRTRNLGGHKADAITIYFMNAEVAKNEQKNKIFAGPISEQEIFEPIEIVMNMNTQHWLSFGSRKLATGNLLLNHKEIASGKYILEESRSTTENDTLFMDFELNEN